MTEPRLSTVFDYSDLRLHPDGTRVYQKSTSRIAKAEVRTSRNNWIAKDAGGLGNIHKFKTTKKTSQDVQGDEDDGEFISLRTGTDSPKPEDEGKGSGKKRKVKRLDGRKAKRQKFLEDYNYLNRDPSTSINVAADADADAGTEPFPYEPSPDLLKCIHRYASEYYTESGQLLNSSRDYRRQRKKRRDEMKKAKDRTEASSASPMNSQVPTPNDGSESDTLDHGNEDTSNNKSEEKDKPQQRKGRQRTSKQYRDMYKLFDGSAIMAIGMLVQEYIAEALDPQPPDEWDEDSHHPSFA